MAMPSGDGSIVLTTKIDETGIEKGMSKLKSGIGAVGRAFALVGTAAAAGFVAISKSAVDSYAEYEQLKGGVETLFKDSADVLMGYADRAYQTAGLSANSYMATVTSFSASLLQSLGGDTAKAADYADQAIIDMSDNANKMGTSMEMIQNAYQGFAKQNYTMLDNLKLGYGGTKEEMQRLLDDAEKISGIKYDISSFADVTQAIHVIQTELGITGTTALEASSTIQGSASAMKASWQNLLTGMADPTQNFEQLLQNFISSVGTFLGNLLPVFTTATQGVLQMVQGLLPQIPVLIEQMLPIVIEGVSGIIAGLVEVLPQIVNAVMEILPQLVTAILNMLPQILEAGIQILLSLIQGLTQALPQLIEMLPEIINTIIIVLIENLPLIIEAGIQLLIAIVTGLSKAIPQLIDYIPTIIDTMITTLLENLPLIIDCAIQLLVAIITGLIQALPQLQMMTPKIIWTIVTTLIENLPQLLKAGVQLLESVIKGIGSILSKMGEVGKNIVEGLWNGIKNAKDWLLNKIKSFAHTITDGIKSFFGIHSPSTVFRDEIGKNLMLGMAKGITGNENTVMSAMSKVSSDLSNQNISMPNILSGSVVPDFAKSISTNSMKGNLSNFQDIVDAVNIALAQNGGNNGDIVIKFEGNLAQLGRVLNPVIERQKRRAGTSFSGAY
jgi:phage-related protein